MVSYQSRRLENPNLTIVFPPQRTLKTVEESARLQGIEELLSVVGA